LSSPGSPCESPVKGHHYSVISPGKLKCEVSKSRAFAISQLSAIEREITENSPSKIANVDMNLIERLKERRKSQNRSTQKGFQDSIIDKL
jgi:hypothetical protein